MRILIVDDSSTMRRIIGNVVMQLGFTRDNFEEAEDGEIGLEKIEKNNYDVIILDVKMPRLDGIQAARMIAHDNLAPVVLLTAFGDEDMIEKAKKSMVFGYVMKPVEEKTLFPAIQIAVSQYRQKKDMVDRVKNMERELAARKIVDRAKGLLMDYYHITEEDAYRRMQQTSMKRGITIADVAQKVVKEIMARKNR